MAAGRSVPTGRREISVRDNWPEKPAFTIHSNSDSRSGSPTATLPAPLDRPANWRSSIERIDASSPRRSPMTPSSARVACPSTALAAAMAIGPICTGAVSRIWDPAGVGDT
jgi:hypothetical protein